MRFLVASLLSFVHSVPTLTQSIRPEVTATSTRIAATRPTKHERSIEKVSVPNKSSLPLKKRIRISQSTTVTSNLPQATVQTFAGIEQPSDAFMNHINQLSPSIVKFWAKFEAKVRAGVPWQSVLSELKLHGPYTKVTLALMEKVQPKILAGESYWEAIFEGFQVTRENRFFQVLESKTKDGIDWKAALAKSSLNVDPSRLDIDAIDKVSALIASGLRYWEARAITHIKYPAVMSENNRKASTAKSNNQELGASVSQDDRNAAELLRSKFGTSQNQGDIPDEDRKPAARQTPITTTAQSVAVNPVPSQFWQRFEQQIRKGSTWQQEMFGNALPVINAAFNNFMENMVYSLRSGRNYYQAAGDAVILCPLFNPLHQMELSIRRGENVDQIVNNLNRILTGDPVFSLISDAARKIANEIIEGKLWVDAAATVFIQNVQSS